MTETFEIEYTHRSFFALEPSTPDEAVAAHPSLIPKYAEGTRLLERSIERAGNIEEGFYIPGTITIDLESVHVPGIELGSDFEILFADTDKGGRQIPAADFRVTIELERHYRKSKDGLMWIIRFVKECTWNRIIQERFDRGIAVARRMLNDQEYEPSPEEKHQHKTWKRMISLMEVIRDKEFEKKDLRVIKRLFDTLKPKLVEFSRADDETGSRRRSFIASNISDPPKTMNGFRANKVERGIEDAKELGKYVFRVFRHYMNKVIRYYKYERMHYWLDEIRNSEEGYFFIKNRALYNGNEVLPYGHHSILMLMLKKDFVYMNENDWYESIEVVKKPEELDRYAEGFELGGILSQAYEAFIDDRFEQSVILAITGLEAELNFVLEDQKRFPDKTKTEFKPEDERISSMIRAGKQYFNTHILPINDPMLANAWEKADRARRRRNGIVHDKDGIKKNIQNRGKVLGWLNAIRRLTFLIDKWREDAFHG